MAAVMRDLLDSPLAERYRFEVIETYRGGAGLRRIVVFALGLAALVRWCLGRGSRLAHVHSAVRGSIYRKAVCVVLLKLMRRPAILHFHAGPGDIDDFAARLGPVRRVLLGRAVRAADRVLSVSTASARHLEQAFGASQIAVVPNPAPTVADEGIESPGSHETPTIAYLGGFANRAKGGEVLVEALPAIVAALPAARFALAGPGSPPDALTAMIGQHPGVEWLGWLDEPAKHRLLAHCDVFVLPSISEGLPVALLEAMAYGRGIVATDVGGVPDVLEPGADAVVVPSRDPAALAEAVTGLAADGEGCARLGEAARARAGRLNREEVCGRLDAIYSELAA